MMEASLSSTTISVSMAAASEQDLTSMDGQIWSTEHATPTDITRKKAREEDIAAAKVWAIYASEAEKYDKSLVESWKSDMDGLLIFAALFSAILTAFIIESYGSLNANSGDLTVHFLEQISHQLAASANGTTIEAPPFPSFMAPLSSRICNALWFISLGLSLACALIATFVQQWARDFLHKADMRSAPIIRARIFSYLYYGLKRFQMPTVVEIIPLLLHGSLFLFFCGLVAFLVPVDIAMSIIAAIILGIVVLVYCILTLLPLCYLDCPYQTPLSELFWRAFQDIKTFLAGQHFKPNDVEASDTSTVKSHKETMVEAMSRTATEFSEERTDRDHRALVWTMKSLSDDTELEPLIEAIPNLLWGPIQRRHVYGTHIQGLLQNPDVHLLQRIEDFLRNCYTGGLSSDVSQRRIISASNALWAIASLFNPTQAFSIAHTLSLDLADIYRLLGHFPWDPTLQLTHHSVSAAAMISWCMFQEVKGHLLKLREYCVNCSDGQNMDSVYISLDRLYSKFSILGIAEPRHHFTVSSFLSLTEEYLAEIPHRIMLNFLCNSVHLESAPYRYYETHRIIHVSDPVPFSLRGYVEDKIDGTIMSSMHRWAENTDHLNNPWIQHSIDKLICLWEPDWATHRIPDGVIVILNHLRFRPVWNPSVHRLKIHLWDCFRRDLSSRLTHMQQEYFTAMWHLISFGLTDSPPVDSPRYPFDSILKAISTAESPFTLVTYSVTALLRFQILTDLNSQMQHRTIKEKDALMCLNHHLCPAESGMHLPEEFCSLEGNGILSPEQSELLARHLHHRLVEGRLDLLTEYLEYCASHQLPYNTAQTVAKLCDSSRMIFVPEGTVYPLRQLRVANSYHQLLSTHNPGCIQLLNEIILSPIWELYATGHQGEEHSNTAEGRNNPTDWHFILDSPWPWLDNPIARQKIKGTFTEYEMGLRLNPNPPRDVLDRLQRILRGIDFQHKEADAPILAASSHANG
ncbi:hypothetical protein K438DRAFT_1717594 [Mycena galopus ATCC 62051]|nr:hypothetical protein K438DRAFT_1717594 [Mycena galopus ATCC 62051]